MIRLIFLVPGINRLIDAAIRLRRAQIDAAGIFPSDVEAKPKHG